MTTTSKEKEREVLKAVNEWAAISLKPHSEDFIRNIILDSNDAFEEKFGKQIRETEKRTKKEIESLKRILQVSKDGSSFTISEDEMPVFNGIIEEIRKYYSNQMTNIRAASRSRFDQKKKGQYENNLRKCRKINMRISNLKVKKDLSSKINEDREIDREIDRLNESINDLKDENLKLIIDNFNIPERNKYKENQVKISKYFNILKTAYRHLPITIDSEDYDIINKLLKKKLIIVETENYSRAELKYPICISYICRYSKFSENFIDELVALTTGKVNRSNYSEEKIEETIRKVIDKKITDRVDFYNIIRYQNVSKEFISKYISIIPDSYLRNDSDM